MRFYARIVVGAAAAALLVSALLSYFAEAWFGEEASVLKLGHMLVFETRRGQAMRARADRVGRSLELKRGIIEQVITGRMNLREAIAQFKEANEMIERIDRSLVAPYQLPDNVEGVGRQVLAWVYNVADSYPDGVGQRRLAELEREFQALFGRSSTPETLKTSLLPSHGSGSVQYVRTPARQLQQGASSLSF